MHLLSPADHRPGFGDSVAPTTLASGRRSRDRIAGLAEVVSADVVPVLVRFLRNVIGIEVSGTSFAAGVLLG
jgi:hypothetical protein